MSRSDRFFRGASLGLLVQAVMFAGGLWVTPLLLSKLGKTDLGLWLVATNLLAYLGLLDFGVVGILPRETAYATGRKDPSEVSQVVARAFQISAMQVPLVAFGSIFVLFLLPSNSEKLVGPFLWMLAAYALLFPLRVFQAALAGLQDLQFLGVLQFALWLLGTAVSVTLVLAGAGLYSVAWSWILSNTVSAAICFARYRSRFPSPRGWQRVQWSEAREWLAKSIWLTASQITQLLRSGTELVLIGKMLGSEAIVPYALTSRLVSAVQHIPQGILSAAQPALSEVRARGSKQSVAQISDALSRLVLIFSGSVCICVVAINGPFVARWVGADLYAGLGLTLLLALNMILRHFSLTVSSCLFCFGYEKPLALTAIVDGLFTVIVMAAGIALFGTVGAAIGPIAGTLLVTLPINLRALARETDQSVGGILKPYRTWLMRFLPLALLAAIASTTLFPVTYLGIAGLCVVLGGLYLFIVGPLTLQEPLGSYVRPKLRSLQSNWEKLLRLTTR